MESTAEKIVDESVEPNEQGMLKHLFESTVTFFRIVNKTMISKGYSRQRRRQIFESIVKKASLEDKDIIAGMMEELKPVFENKGEANV
jgi:hypothetical protein